MFSEEKNFCYPLQQIPIFAVQILELKLIARSACELICGNELWNILKPVKLTLSQKIYKYSSWQFIFLSFTTVMNVLY